MIYIGLYWLRAIKYTQTHVTSCYQSVACTDIMKPWNSVHYHLDHYHFQVLQLHWVNPSLVTVPVKPTLRLMMYASAKTQIISLIYPQRNNNKTITVFLCSTPCVIITAYRRIMNITWYAWTACQIRKFVGCACAGNAGNWYSHEIQ